MHEGTVKWFNDAKGYGYILSPMGDVMVHHTVIRMSGYRTLSMGQIVRFEVTETGMGLRATLCIPGPLPDTEKEGC